jgi:multicomponent Na+:H+ antiporter subunit G
MRDVIASILLLGGCSLTLIAAFGLHRMPDLYARIHVATKPATLGLALTLAGAAVRLGTVPAVATLTLAMLFQLITTPVGSHLIARAAHRVRVPVGNRTVLDELPVDEPEGGADEAGRDA